MRRNEISLQRSIRARRLRRRWRKVPHSRHVACRTRLERRRDQTGDRGPVLGLCDPLDWDDGRLQQEIERCIVKVRPLETKSAAKAEQNLDNIT